MPTCLGGVLKVNKHFLFANNTLDLIGWYIVENRPVGHHRFLPTNHRFRKYKTREWGQAPSRLSGAEVKKQFSNVLTEYKIEDLKRGERIKWEKW